MPFDYGFRLKNRQGIANAKPIKENKNQGVDGAEGLFLRSGSPQNVYLLPQHPNFHLERCPRPKQICDHPNNEPDKISHPARASPDSRSTASQIEFATGTPRYSTKSARHQVAWSTAARSRESSIAIRRSNCRPFSGLYTAALISARKRARSASSFASRFFLFRMV